MSGNVRGVQTVMRETYPNAQFVHCYAHQLNLTLQQLCSARMSILKVINAPGINSALCRFKENVQKMRQQTDALAATTHDGTDEPGRRVSSTAPVMKEACETVISQVEQRFSQSDHLIAAKLVDSSFFPQHVLSFSTPELDCAVKLWPALGNKEKLKSELTTLYHHSELHTGTTALS
ncbi:hypothetical protein NQZ68_001092, partial [Dissostichus eleginoides]